MISFKHKLLNSSWIELCRIDSRLAWNVEGTRGGRVDFRGSYM